MSSPHLSRGLFGATEDDTRDGMQLQRYVRALERLHAITSAPGLGIDEKINQLLELGREVFGLSLGIVSCIDGQTYTIDHIVGPEGSPAPGARFDVEGTYCIHTLRANKPLGFHHVSAGELRTHPCYRNFRLESYLGIPLLVNGWRYGTVNFSDPQPRAKPFDDSDYALLRLFAHWIGTELARTQSARELEHQKRLFESMFENAPDAITLTDADHCIVMVNPAFTRLFGYRREEIIGQRASLLYSDHEEYQREAEIHQPASDKERATVHEVEYRHKDGSLIPAETVGSVLRDGQGEIIGFLAHIRDVTERKKIERLKDEFVSTVSHELRTPLTSIRGVLGLLLGGVTGPLEPQAHELISLADKNSQRLLHLINDLLDMEKIASGQMEFVIRRQSLMPLIDQALRANEHFARQYGVDLTLTNRVPELLVDVDEERLGQILSNLISNAAKFSPEGGSVDVAVAMRDDGVRITVTDHGPGISQEFREKIFEKFSQADGSTTRRRGGTGLGLAISRAIARRLGGEIGFDSVPGTGATFFLDLPCTPPGRTRAGTMLPE